VRSLVFFLFCAILATPSVKAQFILNQKGEAFGDLPFFNAELIAASHIERISGFYTYKKGDEAFKPSADRFEYRFNTKGQLISSMEIIQKGNTKDSSFHHYAYFENGLLQMHRYAAYGGALCEHYQYDSLQRLISVALFRDIYDHRKDTLISSVKMRTETLRYHLDAQQNYTRYNNYQRPYLEVSSIFNPDGYLTQEQTYFRISQTTQTTFFTYNETGLLAKKSLLQSENATPIEEWRYRYDQWGNLIEMHLYKEGIFKTDYQIVYDYKTGFLGSLILKDVANNQLRILRFTNYSYYPKQ